jgi:peroxiredoxin Q/BCP
MAAASCVMLGRASAEVGVGDDAPAFSLVGSDGKTYTNEDFEGEQVVVIAWYPKAFTGG